MKKESTILAMSLIALSAVMVTSPPAAGKKELEAIQKLEGEILILQRQVRDLQEAFARNSGQIVTLISQVNDSVSTTARSVSALQQSLSDTQARITGNASRFESRFVALESALQATNQRLVQLNDQVSGLNEALTQLQHRTPSAIDPTDPIQLFSSAYGDYLRGNYELAAHQFRQFVQRFPSLETTDDAQYWVGECHYAMGRYEDAVSEFDTLIANYPRSNKLAATRLKKGLALLELNRTDEAIAELRLVAKGPSDSPETIAATERLNQLGVPTRELKPAKAVRPRRKKGN